VAPGLLVYNRRMPLHLALTGAIPALVAMWYFDRLDRKRPEPRRTLRLVALAGALSVIPVLVVGYLLLQVSPAEHSYEGALYHSFVVAAAVEELAKVLCVYWFVWHRPEFDERLDGIVYATRAGLGFAMIENIAYLSLASSMGDFLLTFVLRALLAVPGHAIWAGIAGYYMAVRRFDGRGPGLLGGLAIAVLLHGAYDAAIFLQVPLHADGHQGVALALLSVPFAIIIGGGIFLRRLARRALHADDAAEQASR
jgi:RsiW-degrading membrane proteinase PrsW (M82 family)